MRDYYSALHSLSQAKAAIEVAQSFLMTEAVRKNTDIQVFTNLIRESANLIQGFSLAVEALEKYPPEGGQEPSPSDIE